MTLPTHPPHHEASEKLFERSRAVIPGGVNSRCAPSTPWAALLRLRRRLRAPTCTTRTATSTLTWSAPGARRFWATRTRRSWRAVQQAAARACPSVRRAPPEAELAELVINRINAAIPGAIEQVRMVSTGTEATMTAIRLARGVTGRDKIIKFAGRYHGHVDAPLPRPVRVATLARRVLPA